MSKWYSIPWFGGVKVECETCHTYTTEWSEEASKKALYELLTVCGTCVREKHLIDAQREIAKLKGSINEWKDAWFHQREIIGRLSWEHNNCPREKVHVENSDTGNTEDH